VHRHGFPTSEGALVNMLDDSRVAFARQASLIRAKLLAGTILASDETSMRVGRQNWWAWVFHHADSACFVVHPNRSRAVVEEFLGTYRPDFWVSDRLASQMGWAKKDHQVCLAHAAHGPHGMRESTTVRNSARSGQLEGRCMRMRATCTITRALPHHADLARATRASIRRAIGTDPMKVRRASGPSGRLGHHVAHSVGHRVGLDDTLDCGPPIFVIGTHEGAGGPECRFASRRPEREISHARKLLKADLGEGPQAMGYGVHQGTKNERSCQLEIPPHRLLGAALCVLHGRQGSGKSHGLASRHPTPSQTPTRDRVVCRRVGV
jgi:hypothetical protein